MHIYIHIYIYNSTTTIQSKYHPLDYLNLPHYYLSNHTTGQCRHDGHFYFASLLFSFCVLPTMRLSLE